MGMYFIWNNARGGWLTARGTWSKDIGNARRFDTLNAAKDVAEKDAFSRVFEIRS